MKSSSVNTRTLSWIMVALLAVFLLAQGLPYFTYGEGETASIFGYLAMPSDYPALESHLAAGLGSFEANDIVGVCIPLQLVALVLLVLVIKFKDNPVLMGICAGWGVWGIIGYLANAALGLGGWVRSLYLVLFIASAVIGIVCVISAVAGMKRSEKEVSESGQVLVHGT